MTSLSQDWRFQAGPQGRRNPARVRIDGNGFEFNYATQLIASDLLKPGGIGILGFRYFDGAKTDLVTATLDGRYPIGRVSYRDADCPVEVQLEAFSPFIPLHADDSSLPATVMSFRVKNTGDSAVDAHLVGQMQNAVCLECHQGRRRRLCRHRPRSSPADASERGRQQWI